MLFILHRTWTGGSFLIIKDNWPLKKNVIYGVEKLEPSYVAGRNVKNGADAAENSSSKI